MTTVSFMETHLHRLLHLLDGPAFIASEQSEMLYMNGAMRQLTGRENVERQNPTLIGLGIFSNQAEYRGFMRGFSSVGPVQRLRLPSDRLKAADHEVTLKAVMLPRERVVFGTIQLEGVSPKIESQVSNTMKSIVDFLPQMILTADGKGTLKYLNQTAATYLDAEAENPKQPNHILKVDAELTGELWKRYVNHARKEGTFRYETHFQSSDGRLLPVEVVISQVEGFPVHSVTLVAQDITRQRNDERKLEATKLEVDRLLFRENREKIIREEHLKKSTGLKAIVTSSVKYRRLLKDLRRVAATDSTVLITGETGTGKELLAKAIHEESPRAKEALVTVNCGALPRDLIESELFGYRKGAFTGATRDHPGRFQLADGGTLFLDEIGELEITLQTRLLRFLQEGEFSPIGSTKLHYADVRIIAATNRDLAAMVREKTFRTDLYFRLDVFPIVNPPLRERREDIEPLIEHFISKHRRRLNSSVTSIAPAFLEECQKHSFPGNIRELENIVERALITSPGPTLQPDFRPNGLGSRKELDHKKVSKNSGSVAASAHLGFEDRTDFETLETMQRTYIESVLQHTNGKVSGPGGAAEVLGLKAQTLYSKIRKLGVKKYG